MILYLNSVDFFKKTKAFSFNFHLDLDLKGSTLKDYLLNFCVNNLSEINVNSDAYLQGNTLIISCSCDEFNRFRPILEDLLSKRGYVLEYKFKSNKVRVQYFDSDENEFTGVYSYKAEGVLDCIYSTKFNNPEFAKETIKYAIDHLDKFSSLVYSK